MQVIKRRSKVFKKNMSLGRSLKFLKTIGPQELVAVWLQNFE